MRLKSILMIIIILTFTLCSSCSSIQSNQQRNSNRQELMTEFNKILDFVDLIIKSYTHMDSVIFNSQFYDKNYSIIKFMHYRFSDYFKYLSENGYEIDEIDYFNIIQLERFRQGEATERYPEYETIEIVEVSHILNVYVIQKGMVRDWRQNNGAVVFTFCQKKDGSWYLRLVDFEYVIL